MNKFILTLLMFVMVLAVRVAANDIVNRDEEKLQMLRAAFGAYAAKNECYPAGSNAEIVRQLSDPKNGIRFEADVDFQEILRSSKGRPIVFLFSENGWVIIAMVDESGTRFEREVSLPPWKKKQPNKTPQTTTGSSAPSRV